MLENHHAATFFFLIEEKDCDILGNFKTEDQTVLRKQIVDNILYTDMSKHFPFMAELKGLPSKDDFDPQGKHKPDLFKAIVHASDVGNPTRPYEVSKVWSLKILAEFFS